MGIISGASTRWLFIHCIQIELKCKMLVSEERRKQEFPEKNLMEQGREPTTNFTHI